MLVFCSSASLLTLAVFLNPGIKIDTHEFITKWNPRVSGRWAKKSSSRLVGNIVLSHTSFETRLLSLRLQYASLLSSLFSFQPRIPPPDYKLPPEKLGYLRHVTPGPKQVMPDNFHVENIHLRHAYRPSSSHSEVPRYAHLLRKTGRRGELGIQDDEESEVTRVCFNVPLVGVTWKQILFKSVMSSGAMKFKLETLRGLPTN